MTAPALALSVVVPFFNEEAVAYEVADELGRQMEALGLCWEAILVNDGSADRTGAELERVRAKWPQCRVLQLSRNYGQGAALLYGIEETRAPIIAMMDGDGQNVPADIGVLLPLLDRADLAVGVRARRHDSRLRLVLSKVANSVRGRILGDRLSDAGCALKVFRREIIASFLPVHMLNPFMPALAVSAGFQVAEQAVRHRARLSGESKYGLRVILWRPLFDMLAIWWILKRRIPVQRTAPRQPAPAGPAGRSPAK